MPINMIHFRGFFLIGALVSVAILVPAQNETLEPNVEVHAHLEFHPQKAGVRLPPAVLWLKPLPGTAPQPFAPQGHYTLLQKNRMFSPHLLVIPVGSVVQFPNADPFFHNVFSLFNGKRFDLGLYEAGSTKAVNFSREGVSYIFCNIHPEMSAVVLALSTPLYALADPSGMFSIRDVPAGDYEIHVWIEGFTQPTLDRLARRVHVAPGAGNLGVLDASGVPLKPASHLNKFGQPYDEDSKPPY
jgi:hypothetical protein